MFNSVKRPAMTFLAVIASSVSLVVFAQNTAPSFFGSGSQSTVAPKAASTAKPSTTQVWSKDDFTKKTTELNTKRETNFQNKLNSSLKPVPAKTASAPVTTPAPAGGFNSSGGSTTPVQNPSNQQTTSTAATPSTPASTTAPSSGYTGFGSGSGTQTKTPAQGSGGSSSGGWNVTY